MLQVLVPRPGTRAAKVILPKSGIVARLTHGETKILTYFEGNKYGSAGLDSFDNRVLTAAGRLLQTYPTVAKGLFDAGDFEVIGVLHCTSDLHVRTLVIDDQEGLDEWLWRDEK